jgi:predicted secreted protein
MSLMDTSKGRILGEEEKTENIIKAKLNQSFTIALDSLPTAGYKWTVEHDSGFLRLDNECYMTSNPATIGGGSVEVFAFTPQRSGETEVIAIYKRPWEDKVENKRAFKIIISE